MKSETRTNSRDKLLSFSMLQKVSVVCLLVLVILMTGCSKNDPDPDPVELTEYEQLVKDYGETYKHLTWFDISEYEDIETIASIKLLTKEHDISDLIDQYGDAWPFALELSIEEVESTFDYIVWLSIEIDENGVNSIGQDGIKLNSEINVDYGILRREIMEYVSEMTEHPVSLYSEYYKKDFAGNYGVLLPASFSSSETRFAIGNDNKDLISFKDKDWYVRDFILRYSLNLITFSENKAEPVFYFEGSK